MPTFSSSECLRNWERIFSRSTHKTHGNSWLTSTKPQVWTEKKSLWGCVLVVNAVSIMITLFFTIIIVFVCLFVCFFMSRFYVQKTKIWKLHNLYLSGWTSQMKIISLNKVLYYDYSSETVLKSFPMDMICYIHT